MADEILKRDADRNTVSGGVTNNAALGIVMLRVDPTTKRLLVDSNAADITSIIPGVGATNLGKAEDAVHASGDVGVMALAVRNDDLTPLAADGDYHPLTIDGHAGLHTAPEHTITLDELAATAGWTVLGTDTTGLTTNADHISGTASVEFDKVDGAAGTVFAGIQKTLTSTDLSLFHIHESIHLAINISSLTNVDYVFVRLGTDSSHYNEWRIQDDDLTTGWQVLKMVIGNASTAGSTGNGWNPAAVTYAAVGVAFDDEADELLNIRVNHLSLHSGLHTTSDITSEVSTSVNSPNIRLVDYGGSISTGSGVNGSGVLRVTIATDDEVNNFLGTIDTDTGNIVTAVQLIDDVVYVDDADWTDSSSKHLLVGGLYQSTQQTVTDGDVAPLEIDANGNLKVYLATKLDNVNDSILIYANTVKDGTGTDLVPLVDADGNLQVDVLSGTITTVSTLSAITGLTMLNAAAQVTGDEAHDAVDAGNPAKIGGRAQDIIGAEPEEVADNDRVDALFDQSGRIGVTAGSDYKYADINDATSGNNTIIAAQAAGKRIAVWAILVVSDGTTDVRWEDGAGGTAFTGQVPLQAREGYSISAGGLVPLFVGSAATLLNLELTAAVNVHGFVSYTVLED